MNHNLKVIVLVNTLFTFAVVLLTPMYALFITKIGGGAEIAGILFAVTFLSSFLADLFIVRVKDKNFLDAKMLKYNYLIKGFCWLLLVFFQTIPAFFLVQVILGYSEALGTPAFNSLFGENLDKKSHIREWGVWELIKNPAVAVASILSGFIVTYLGFTALFFVMATLAFVCLFLFDRYYE